MKAKFFLFLMVAMVTVITFFSSCKKENELKDTSIKISDTVKNGQFHFEVSKLCKAYVKLKSIYSFTVEQVAPNKDLITVTNGSFIKIYYWKSEPYQVVINVPENLEGTIVEITISY